MTTRLTTVQLAVSSEEANGVSIESSASRFTVSISSKRIPVVTVIELCRRIF
ncbi:hypothetical protein [Nocardia beijingensis]